MGQRRFKAKAEAINTFRANKGWTLADLADKSGRSSRTIDGVMAGRSAFISTFASIAKALGVQVGEIAELEQVACEQGNPPAESPAPTIEAPATADPAMVTFEVSFKFTFPFKKHDETVHMPLFVDMLERLLMTANDMKARASEGTTTITVSLTEDEVRTLLAISKDFSGAVGRERVAVRGSESLEDAANYSIMLRPLLLTLSEIIMPSDAEFLSEADKGKAVPVTADY